VHRIWIRIQFGSGQPDSLPCSSTNHCKHALCFITQCQEGAKSLNNGAASQQITKLSCLLWFDVLISSLVAIQLWSGLGYIQIRIRWRCGSGRIWQ